MASAEVGILYQDSSRDAGSTRRSAGKQATSPPHVELIDLADQERRPRHCSGAETVPGSTEPARTAGSSAGPFATGAVICGSAAAIGNAMGTRILDADVMLAYVRRRVWDDRYDGKHHSVMSALRAVQNLQVVVFLDPFQGQGLWIDVDPARQVPAAWLLIEMDLSAGLPGRFRFFRLQESVSP
jgi:hypothetical protein